MSDFLFKKDVDIYDPNVNGLVEFEAERQARRLIMIPSESIAPKAVRDLLASPFTNIYAEGYPRPETRYQDEETIMDYAYQNTWICWKPWLAGGRLSSSLQMTSTLTISGLTSNRFPVPLPTRLFIPRSSNQAMPF